MTTPVRVLLVLVAIALFEAALLNIVAWHNYAWIFVAIGVAALLGYGVLEVRRYTPQIDRSADTWKATDETFVDPTTGEKVVVYYDAVSGKRDYRAAGP